jgi:hypothetical protein
MRPEFRYKSERDRAWDVAAKEGIQRVERGTPRNLYKVLQVQIGGFKSRGRRETPEEEDGVVLWKSESFFPLPIFSCCCYRESPSLVLIINDTKIANAMC